MIRALCILATLAFALDRASAQTPNPVMQHYRAYNTALEAGDLVGAEAAAAAALAASEQRDGDGGNTAVLAANLAQVRLNLGRLADALAPAQRAVGLVQSRGASNVDPVLAQLLLGRAELSQSGEAGQRRLQPALETAIARGDLDAEAYDAAVSLGRWGIAQIRHRVAAEAYSIAVDASQGDNEGQKLARADALIGMSVARLLADEPGMRGQTGTRVRNRPEEGPGEALAEALRLSRPIAVAHARAAPTGPSTRAQTTYGTALAWMGTYWARARSMGWTDVLAPGEHSGITVDLNEADGLSVCSGRYSAEPRPEYPPEALGESGVGSVVMRVVVNDAGEITDRRIVGVAGGTAFLDSVRAVYERWNIRLTDAAQCSQARVVFTPVTFTMLGGR